jgi:hypothetical protein
MDIIPQAKKNIILDATMLSTIQSCGRLADFRFNHHFQSLSGKSPSLEMGSIVHAYLEKMYEARINGINRTDAHQFGLTSANAYALSSEVKNSTQEDKAFAIDTCEQYYEHYKNDHWIPLEVETVKSEVLYTDDEIRIMWKAKLDLIADTSQGIYPVDHKTMKQRRDSISLNNQFTGQCILMKTRSVFINKIGFQKTLKPSEKFSRPPVNYSMDRLLEWQTQILPYWAYQWLSYNESEYFPPNYTHCENKYGFCAFKDVCDADRNMRETIIGMNFEVGEPWSI